MRALQEVFLTLKTILAQLLDDVVSLVLAVVSSVVPALWFCRVRLPFPWWPVWAFQEWVVVFVCVFFVFRLWRTLRKAAV